MEIIYYSHVKAPTGEFWVTSTDKGRSKKILLSYKINSLGELKRRIKVTMRKLQIKSKIYKFNLEYNS